MCFKELFVDLMNHSFLSFFNSVLLILLATMLQQCSSQRPDGLEVVNHDLKGERMTLSGAVFNFPFNCHLFGSKVLVEDNDNEYHYRLVDLKSGVVSRVGKIGNGPGELVFPTTIYRIPNSDKIGLNMRSRFLFA